MTLITNAGEDTRKWLEAFRTQLIDNINKIERDLKTAFVEAEEMEGCGRFIFELSSKGKLSAFKEFLRLSDSSEPEKIRLIAETLNFGLEELNDEYGFETARLMIELRRLKIADYNTNPEFYFGSGRYPSRNNSYKEDHLDNFQISRGIFSLTFRTVTAFLYEAGILPSIFHSDTIRENGSYSPNIIIRGAEEAVGEVLQYFDDYPEPKSEAKPKRRAASHVETAFYADAPESEKWFMSPPSWTVSDVVELLSDKISGALSEIPDNAFRGGYIFTLATIRTWITDNPDELTPEALRAVFSYLLGALYLQYSEHLPVSAKLHYAMNGSYITRNDIFRFLYFDRRLDPYEKETLVDYGNADWSLFHPQFITASAFVLAAGGIVYDAPDGVNKEEYVRDRHSGILTACDTIRKGLKLSEIISDTTDYSVHRFVYSLISVFREKTFPDSDS